MKRILIADTQFLTREGLKSLLAGHPDFFVVAEAQKAEQLLSQLRSMKPDLLLLTPDRKASLGVEAIDQIRALYPGLGILLISDEADQTQLLKLLDTGVMGFLTKHCSGEEILDAIRVSLRGERFFCNKILNFLLDLGLGKQDDCRLTPLTQREMEIVRLTADGLQAKEMAQQLDLSLHTVYTHRKNILKKLGLRSASELVRYALEEKLIP